MSDRKFLKVEDVVEFSYADEGTYWIDDIDLGKYVWHKGENENTILPFEGTLQGFIKEMGIHCVVAKGRKMIGDFCGNKVKIVQRSQK